MTELSPALEGRRIIPNTDKIYNKSLVYDETSRYTEIRVDSFKSAVREITNDIVKWNDTRAVGNSHFCLIDIDGTLIENDLVKLPFVSRFVKPEITEDTQKAFDRLYNLLDGSIAIATNRSDKEKMILNSTEVLNSVKGLISDRKIPIYTNLFKQIPGLTKEDISKQYIEDNGKISVKKPNSEELIHIIGKRVCEDTKDNQDSYKLTLYSIEDLSIASPNRDTFLKYVAKRLHSEYGIDVNIRNLVIKR